MVESRTGGKMGDDLTRAPRCHRRIGSATHGKGDRCQPEAAPVLYLADQAVKDVLEQMPFADICITSDLTLSTDAAPSDAFTWQRLRVSPYPSSGRG